jgi:hypothetical protein
MTVTVRPARENHQPFSACGNLSRDRCCGYVKGMTPRHPAPNCGLADLDAELEQFPVDAGRAHNGLALLIPRIKSRISVPILGRPGQRDRQRQWSRNPLRCNDRPHIDEVPACHRPAWCEMHPGGKASRRSFW